DRCRRHGGAPWSNNGRPHHGHPYATPVLGSTACVRCPGVPARAGVPRPLGEYVMGIMSIIGVIIVGFLVGVLARWFYPGFVEMGWVLTTVLGIAGSFLGGFLSSVLFRSPDGVFDPAAWFLSVRGALIIR